MVKNPPANAEDARHVGSIPGSGRFSWSRKWQPTPVFFPGEFHGQRSGEGCQSLGPKSVEHEWAAENMSLPHFIYSAVNGHLVVSTFWLLWIMLLWTVLCKLLFEPLFSTLFGKHLGVEFLGYVIILCLMFWGPFILFYWAGTSFYIPINNIWVFQYIPFHTNTSYLPYRHPRGYEAVSHCSFNLHFPGG